MGNPNSIKYLDIDYPYDKKDPNSIIKFLFDLHYRKNLIPKRKFNTYFREAKKILEELGPDKVILLMLKAIEICDYPFGFQLVRRLNEQNPFEIE